jgi:hypothetical protein
MIYKDDFKLFDMPDIEPKWERPVFMAIWFDFNRKIDSTFVNRSFLWIDGFTEPLWEAV